MGKAKNLYFTEDDLTKIESIRKELKKRGLTFVDQKGNDSTSALLRYLVDEKDRELRTPKTHA